MTRWSFSQWFVALVAFVSFVASATIAANVTYGVYPPWAAWPAWWLNLVTVTGVGILAHETRREKHDAVNIHRVG